MRSLPGSIAVGLCHSSLDVVYLPVMCPRKCKLSASKGVIRVECEVECESFFSSRETVEINNNGIIRTLGEGFSNTGIGLLHNNPCCSLLGLLNLWITCWAKTDCTTLLCWPLRRCVDGFFRCISKHSRSPDAQYGLGSWIRSGLKSVLRDDDTTLFVCQPFPSRRDCPVTVVVEQIVTVRSLE